MLAVRFRPSRVLLVIAVVMLAGPLASESLAGSYQARFCHEGGNADGADKGPFERSGNETVYSLANACGAFNGLRVSQQAGQEGAEGTFGRWLAQRPDSISVTGIAYAAQGERSGGYFPQVIGTQPGGGLGIINGDQELDGDFKDFSVSGDLRQFGIQLICQTGGSTCAQNPPAPPEAGLKAVTYSLEDPTAPAVSITGGTLFEGKAQIGSQAISFDAADGGSGVLRVIAMVNGEEAGSVGPNCNSGKGFALGFTPCPAAFSGELALDTAAAPWRIGRNKVRLCVEDYSSDSRRCTESRSVLALNGCATNSAAATGIELEWPGKRGVVQSRQGRARTAIARVFGGGRTPLAGASVCFSRGIPGGEKGVERILEGAAATDAGGRARVKVRGQSSRTIRATYFAGPEDVLTARIRLKVSPAIRLELRPDGRVEAGEKVRAVAMLRGKWQAGRKVCFYVSKRGRDKYACDTTGKGGRARAGFETEKPGKLRFYAKVPNQRDYPYVRGRSETKHKRVLP